MFGQNIFSGANIFNYQTRLVDKSSSVKMISLSLYQRFFKNKSAKIFFVPFLYDSLV